MELPLDKTYDCDKCIAINEEKLAWDMVPFETLEGVVRVLMFGAAKHGEFDYINAKNYKRKCFASLLRHLFKWWKGEKIDPETGESALSHALCRLMFLIYREMHGIKD